MKRIVVFALVLNAALLGVIAHQLVAIACGGAVATQNGDTNGDGARDITDAVYLLSWLFPGGAEPVAFAQQGGNDEEVAELKELIESHHQYTGSTVAEQVLSQWESVLPQFVKVMPSDYKLYLEEQQQEQGVEAA